MESLAFTILPNGIVAHFHRHDGHVLDFQYRANLSNPDALTTALAYFLDWIAEVSIGHCVVQFFENGRPGQFMTAEEFLATRIMPYVRQQPGIHIIGG